MPVDETRVAAVQRMMSGARKGFEVVASTGMAGDEKPRPRPGVATHQGSAGSLQLATARPKDPLWYWKQNNLPFDIWEDRTGKEMMRVHEMCRLLYVTHPLLGSAIDIYARYPLSGMEIVCGKDQSIADFYSDLFLDDLNYDEYLVDIGREHWLVGEAFPLASFNDLTGVWDSDALMIPEDVNVIKTPFATEPRYEMALPYSIRKILNARHPQLEYRQLIENYPEFLKMNISDWITTDSQRYLIPVSGQLMQHVMRKGDSFHPRGISIMMRAFRAVAQEEMLNSAQDSISQRLYTPLLMARIGASATDLGMDTAWIPSQADLDAFVEDVNLALSADFRLIVTHFAAQIQSVFGREAMPDLSGDYDRLEDKMLQSFGLSKTMLSGADCLSGDTVVQLSRAGKGFKTTIEKLARRCAGLPMPGRVWDESIPTYINRADGEVVRLGPMDTAWFAGIKETFELTTESGKSIRASAQHPFLTPSGDWVQLGDLNVGDLVQVNTGRRNGQDRVPRNQYRQVFTKFHPYQTYDGKHARQDRYKVPVHRVVMEAALNEMEYDDFVWALREQPIRCKEFTYLDPMLFIVHHQDENYLNNELSNLAVMARSEHYQHHGDETRVLWQVGSETIVSIVSHGMEATYDIGVGDAPHNFIANGFVVHNSGQTYAADALNRDLVTQLLSEYQRKIKRFFRKRCEVVAEAQGHYDFERKGNRSVPIMERVQETDPETGDIRFIERPKLLLPELRIKAMNMKDEEKLEQLLSDLRAAGVPISQRSRLINMPIDLDEEEEATMQEQVEQAVMAQEVRRRTYLALQARGLPIPDDLKADFQPHLPKPPGSPAQNGAQQPPGAPVVDPATATLGLVDPASTTALAPTDDAINALTTSAPGGSPVAPKQLERRNRVLDPSRPPESDEQRAGMPKASSLAPWADDFILEPSDYEMDIGHKVSISIEGKDGEETENVEVTAIANAPVVGSYRTRHMGKRDVRYFYQEPVNGDGNGEFVWDAHTAELDESDHDPSDDLEHIGLD